MRFKKNIFVLFVCLAVPTQTKALDRITLKTGDIFLATIVNAEGAYYKFERFGFFTRIPKKEIKEILSNQTELPINVNLAPLPTPTPRMTLQNTAGLNAATPPITAQPTPTPTPILSKGTVGPFDPLPKVSSLFERLGSPTEVISSLVIEPSHFEMYPAHSYHWMQKERYLRGYLVNRTQFGYRSLRVEITFYTALPGTPGATQPHTDIHKETELFDVYPLTMKPFIVDTHFVDWEKVKQIEFQIIGRKPFDPSQRISLPEWTN